MDVYGVRFANPCQHCTCHRLPQVSATHLHTRTHECVYLLHHLSHSSMVSQSPTPLPLPSLTLSHPCCLTCTVSSQSSRTWPHPAVLSPPPHSCQPCADPQGCHPRWHMGMGTNLHCSPMGFEQHHGYPQTCMGISSFSYFFKNLSCFLFSLFFLCCICCYFIYCTILST